jgi:hypothetical protein
VIGQSKVKKSCKSSQSSPETPRRQNPAPEYTNATFLKPQIVILKCDSDRNRTGEQKERATPGGSLSCNLMVWMTRFELVPPCSRSRYATRLRYSYKSRLPGSIQRYWNAGSVRISHFGQSDHVQSMREDK